MKKARNNFKFIKKCKLKEFSNSLYLFRKNVDVINGLNHKKKNSKTFRKTSNNNVKLSKNTKNQSLKYDNYLIRKEILYRVTRIVMVICIFTIFTFFRNSAVESYNLTSLDKDYLLNSLQVTELTKGINREDMPISDEIGSSNDGYILKVENSSDRERNVTFVAKDTLEDKSLALDHKYVRYQIICDGKVVKTSNISENGVLYETTLEENSKSIYEIKFWIDEDAMEEAYGKKFSVKITLI